MFVGLCKLYLHAGWVGSLKDKRSILRALIDKTKSKFNISIAEVGDNDILNSIVIGLSCVSNNRTHAEAMLQNVIGYIENNGEAELIEAETEIYHM